jgi:hypothetical protein
MALNSSISGCTRTVLESTGSGFQVQVHCEEGQAPSDETLVVKDVRSDSVEVTVQLVTSNKTATAKFLATYRGRGCVRPRVQTTSTSNSKLALKAALVLTPEFCATTVAAKMGVRMTTLEVGRAACAELQSALGAAFSSLTRVTSAAAPGDAQVVLLPRIVDAGGKFPGFNRQEITVWLEWIVKDTSGKPMWVETVPGFAKGQVGNALNMDRDRQLLVQEAARDTAAQSAAKMAAAPELRKVAR